MADVDDRLWATPLDEQRRRDAETERVEAEPARREPEAAAEPAPTVDAGREPGHEQAPAARAPRADLRLAGVIALLAVVVGVPAGVMDRGTTGLSGEVPSDWLGTKMSCDTARFDRGPVGFEFFRCRATGDGRLPAGFYVPPNANWTSDVDRLPARISRIEIARDGQLTGWAQYVIPGRR